MEEIYVISRRVGFTDDVEDNEEKSNQKLIRRDTPHYTKRARIQSKTADGVDSEEAVLKILEKYRASVSPNPDSNSTEVSILFIICVLLFVVQRIFLLNLFFFSIYISPMI
ncbi:unnamed protein product [Trichobilharzia regenti]|nr:unnamed protein product [Trichobilharzia regenti]